MNTTRPIAIPPRPLPGRAPEDDQADTRLRAPLTPAQEALVLTFIADLLLEDWKARHPAAARKDEDR
jgi:hypothetical protein